MKPDALTTLQQQLASARSHLKRATLRGAVVRAIEPALWIACTVATCFLVLRLGGGLNLSAGVLFALVLCCSLGVGIGLSALIHVLPAWNAIPDLEEAAERLDLATSNHNRIATAINFAQQSTPSALETAAIQDGIRTVELLKSRIPSLDPALLPWRRLWTPLVTLGVICVAALLLFDTAGLDSPAAGVGTEPIGVHATPVKSTDSDENPAQKENARPPRDASARSDSTASQSNSPSDRDQRTNNKPSNGVAEAGNALAAVMGSTAGSGSSVTAGAQSTNQRRPKQRAKTAKESKQAEENPDMSAKQQPAPSAGGSAGANSKASKSVMNTSPTLQATEPSNEEDNSNDEDDDEEERASKQRGGVQPTAKDRNAAPTRDLGLGSSLQGKPGTGRGGPTPAKKSRGTASLVLGVPVPDHVRGQLRSGKDKIVRGKTAPVDNPGSAAPSVPVTPRNTDESRISRFELPPDVRHAVSNFFVTWHASDGQNQASTPGTDSPAATEINHE